MSKQLFIEVLASRVCAAQPRFARIQLDDVFVYQLEHLCVLRASARLHHVAEVMAPSIWDPEYALKAAAFQKEAREGGFMDCESYLVVLATGFRFVTEQLPDFTPCETVFITLAELQHLVDDPADVVYFAIGDETELRQAVAASGCLALPAPETFCEVAHAAA